MAFGGELFFLPWCHVKGWLECGLLNIYPLVLGAPFLWAWTTFSLFIFPETPLLFFSESKSNMDYRIYWYSYSNQRQAQENVAFLVGLQKSLQAIQNVLCKWYWLCLNQLLLVLYIKNICYYFVGVPSLIASFKGKIPLPSSHLMYKYLFCQCRYLCLTPASHNQRSLAKAWSTIMYFIE